MRIKVYFHDNPTLSDLWNWLHYTASFKYVFAGSKTFMTKMILWHKKCSFLFRFIITKLYITYIKISLEYIPYRWQYLKTSIFFSFLGLFCTESALFEFWEMANVKLKCVFNKFERKKRFSITFGCFFSFLSFYWTGIQLHIKCSILLKTCSSHLILIHMGLEYLLN